MDGMQRGWNLIAQDDYAAAEQSFRAVLADPETINTQRYEARFGLGYCLAHTGNVDDARDIYTQLRHEARAGASALPEHVVLHQIGMVERLAGDWEAAARCFQEERTMIEGLGNDPLAVAINAYELGFVALHLGHTEESKTHFEESLESAWRTTDSITLGCAHRGLGDWHAKYGERSEALRHWAAAERAFTSAGADSAVQDIQERWTRHAEP
ncbi:MULTISPECIES: tetratricopeptide repeat protein [Deinococcus]|uniref:Tetratricopeptide repeat protein n=1 Tax=Deinococcus rufus TaxID=2136097 RepID=A0ABV7Z705_9DEIO|nr:tetratricopeptide repeat protein [Deinococcus sp. AB2017081]WQE94727.1 tetratricopeptide repeat protein [Deinococcus sp. AB2017081]